MTSVRELVKSAQREIQRQPDLLPERAAELLMMLTSLMGNCADEIRQADLDYANVLLNYLRTEEKANHARIKAETSPEYLRKREARDTLILVTELCRSLKYYLKAKTDELQLARHQ